MPADSTNEAVLPQPEAEVHRLIRDLGEGKEVERIARLKELFEVHAKLHAVVLAKAYLTQEGGEPSQAVADCVREMQSPSLGHWVGLLRNLVAHVREVGAAPGSPAQCVIDPFLGKSEESRDHPAFVAAGILAGYLEQKLAKATNQALFELLVNVRNRLGSGGHGATLSPSDSRRVANALQTVVECLVQSSGLSGPWKLVRIDRVTLVKGEPEYGARLCMGSGAGLVWGCSGWRGRRRGGSCGRAGWGGEEGNSPGALWTVTAAGRLNCYGRAAYPGPGRSDRPGPAATAEWPPWRTP